MIEDQLNETSVKISKNYILKEKKISSVLLAFNSSNSCIIFSETIPAKQFRIVHTVSIEELPVIWISNIFIPLCVTKQFKCTDTKHKRKLQIFQILFWNFNLWQRRMNNQKYDPRHVKDESDGEHEVYDEDDSFK